MKEEETDEGEVEPTAASKQKSGNFQLSDKEVEANEKGAAYPNDGPFGIGMINGPKRK